MTNEGHRPSSQEIGLMDSSAPIKIIFIFIFFYFRKNKGNGYLTYIGIQDKTILPRVKNNIKDFLFREEKESGFKDSLPFSE